jgi:large subunit ribosomal protein L15
LLGKAQLPLKVLANGEISKAVTVQAEKFSETAVAKIEAAGGKVEVIG